MADERPLYEDPNIKIEPMPNSPDDHFIYFISKGQEPSQYIILRGCLREFATTSRDNIGMKMKTLNELMVTDAANRGLSIDSLGFAIAQAYIEEERRIQDFANSRVSQSEE